MANPVEAVLILAGACFSAGAIGASFALGVALVCRWLEWTPVNTKVIINNNHATCDECGELVGREQQP